MYFVLSVRITQFSLDGKIEQLAISENSLEGTRELHPGKTKQAKPLQLGSLSQIVTYRRCGQLANDALHPNSIILLLRTSFQKAAIESPDHYSSHSLRRGFASWASSNHWELKSLKEYVGWRDPKSALKYIETTQQQSKFQFSQQIPTIDSC